MPFILSFIAILYLIDWFVIRRAKKGKRTIIPLIVIASFCFFFGTVALLNMLNKPNIDITGFLLNSVLVLDLVIMIFITDYIATKNKK